MRSSSRFSRVISDAWSAIDGSGGDTGDAATRDRALPPRTAARQFRNIDGEIPTSAATCITGRPLLSSSATVSCLNSGENSLLVFAFAHLHALTGLAKVSTESRDHQMSIHAIGRISGPPRSREVDAVGRLPGENISGGQAARPDP